MKLLSTSIFLWFFIQPSILNAEDFRQAGRGTLREVGGKSPLFLVQYEHFERDGLPLSTTIIHSGSDGSSLVREDVTYAKGKLAEYQMKHLQRGAEATVKIAKGKVDVSWKEGAETKSASLDDSENLVVGGSLLAYMGRHIEEIEAGKRLPLRIVVPDRLTTFDFTLRRVDNDCLKNGAALCAELSIDSILLRPFVKSALLTFRKVRGRYVVLGMEALALPRLKTKNGLEEFRTRIDYPAEIN